MILREAEDGSMYREADDGTWHEYTPQQGDDIQMYGEQKSSDYKPELQGNVKAPQLSAYTADPGALALRNQGIDRSNQYEESLVGDAEAQKMKEKAQGRGFLGGMWEGGKNVVKQFDAGTKQTPDWFPDWAKKAGDYKIGGDNTKTRAETAQDIKSEMDIHDKQYKADRMSSPVATTLGEMIPYLATGAIGEKALLNIGGKLNPAMKNLNIKANKKLGNLDEASRLEKRVAPKKDIFQQNFERAQRGTATGAAEGASARDQTAASGAAGAALGGLSGMMSPLKILDKVPSEGGAGHKAMIKELHKEGFQITPGLRTKNRALQTQEAGMRNSDQLTQTVYNKIDEPNIARLTNMAGEAIGLNTKNDPLIQQSVLRDHMDGLSKEFQALEKNSNGFLTENSRKSLGRILKDSQPTSTRNRSNLAKSRHALIEDIFADLQSGMRADGTGGAHFSGTKYQEITQRIKLESDKAFKDGDLVLKKKLDAIKDTMDDGLKNGMGEGTAKQWADLRERYALSNMLMEGGMTAHGTINPAKLDSTLMSKYEAGNLLTGQGTERKKKLQDMVRYSSFLDDVEGGSLTGLGSADKILTGTDRGLLKRGTEMVLKPGTLAKTNYRLNTMTTPFIGKNLSPAHGISPTATVGLNRAAGQSSIVNDYYQMLTGDTESEEDKRNRRQGN